ncbi:YaaC family protein [Leptospira levettii]|uniref:YaaC family protein n=1 Tax=Leptospira levettii TaxID=2023178 RepID=UPI001EEC440A|nr:YaaC family protein [Leptospira levettii]MCG6150347.1 YaaC family protein [Leptospira levettii]
MRDKEDHERYVATNPDEIIKLRFERLKSKEICLNLLDSKKNKTKSNISDELLIEKSNGLASVVDSALGYLNLNCIDLNTKILSRYYSLMQFSIAEEVADISNTKNLKEIQKNTEYGHGLATVNLFQTEEPSLNNIFTFILQNGHFYHYLRRMKYSNLENITCKKRIKPEEISENLNSIVSLCDLFRRIPELNEIIEEYVGKPPLSLRIGYSSKNNQLRSERMRVTQNFNDPFDTKREKNPNTIIDTYIEFYVNSPSMTVDYLKSLNTPFTDLNEGKDDIIEHNNPIGILKHKETNHWYQEIEIYKSSYSGSTYIIPLLNTIEDPIQIHFMLLYTLSIIARYMPDFWFNLTKGKHAQISNLIDYYLSIFDHIFPKIMLERITEKKIHVSLPGSFDAPI